MKEINKHDCNVLSSIQATNGCCHSLRWDTVTLAACICALECDAMQCVRSVLTLQRYTSFMRHHGKYPGASVRGFLPNSSTYDESCRML